MDQASERYAWLEAGTVRSASDIALGGLLIAAATAALLDSRNLPFGTWHEPGASFFPTVIAWPMVAVGALLLVRGALGRAPTMRWRSWQIVLVAALVAVTGLAGWLLGVRLMLSLGPADFAGAALFILSVAIALARLSRLRGLGMVLLGLLLAIVGTDRITGEERLTMGLEQLADGFALFPVLAPGLLWVADGIVCLLSPPLLLATYTRHIAGWRDPAVPMIVTIGMRAIAALVVASSCYLVLTSGDAWDVGFLLLFAVLGVACKVLGWSRLVLLVGFLCGRLLDLYLPEAGAISRGDPTIFWRFGTGAILLPAAVAILALALTLSLRRAAAPKPPDPAPA